jgi:virulence-associated protein VapD
MADYVIAFDISTKKMKEEGQQNSISKAYTTLDKLLRSCGFTERIQRSTYRTTNNDGINSLIELLARKDELPLFCRFAERVHFLRCEDHSDITSRFKTKDDDED